MLLNFPNANKSKARNGMKIPQDSKAYLNVSIPSQYNKTFQEVMCTPDKHTNHSNSLPNTSNFSSN